MWKYIAGILVLTLLVSTLIIVYFTQKGQTTQSQIQAAVSTNVLPTLIDDCNFRYLTGCVFAPKNIGATAFVTGEVDRFVRTRAPQAVQNYTENVDRSEFSSIEALGMPATLSGNANVARIIAEVSNVSRIHYKLLFALLASQGHSAWIGATPLSNPLGRDETTFTGQFVGLAGELSTDLQNETDKPTTAVKIGTKTYLFDTNLNVASRALYVYLSTNAKDSAEFEQLVGFYNRTNPINFWNTWKSLYQETAFSDQPSLPTAPEAPTENLF